MRPTRLSVANYKTTLSSDSLESGTGSSNSLRSILQSLGFDTFGESFEKTRTHAGFGVRVDPENRTGLRFSFEIPQTYLATISVVPI